MHLRAVPQMLWLPCCVLYQCSPAPEHVVTKKQHNDDLLKELFPDSSDEENEVPSTSTSSVYSNSNDCNSSLIASLVCCVYVVTVYVVMYI